MTACIYNPDGRQKNVQNARTVETLFIEYHDENNAVLHTKNIVIYVKIRYISKILYFFPVLLCGLEKKKKGEFLEIAYKYFARK